MWNDVVTALGQSKDAVQAVFAAIGSIVAILGLRAWRQQLAGKTEYEMASRLLRAVYKVRDQVNSLRSPFISVGEMSSAAKAKYADEDELSQALHIKKNHLAELAYEVRWEKVQEAISDLDVQELEAEVLWGDLLKPILKELYNCLRDLRSTLVDYLSIKRGEYGEISSEDRLKIEKVVCQGWGMRLDGKDEFGDRFGKAITSLSVAVRPYLDIK